ncbi:MAG: ImmA/IrrE family metallo-endopeptidase, partial [Candidatus Eisenbacteria bacterium]|nr:ImmA/IrrE family metallo-endopeptidase [Candidatus Eisenbacteria bacterium]
TLREFLGLIDGYAFLEQIVQGEIRYELPMHTTSMLQSGGPVLEDDGERLARLELELLGEPDTPALELQDRLEDQGIKILTAAPDAEHEEVHGFFLFDGRVGPAFGIDRVREDRRVAFALAHLYGHLVMDVNPYRNRVCGWSRGLFGLDDSPEERRANRFARSLLLPEAKLRVTLEQIAGAVRSGESSPGSSWYLLQEIYEVESGLLEQRFADLGLTTLAQQLRAAATPPPETVPAPPWEGIVHGGFTLPQRYLNLALACRHEEVMDDRMLARFLGVNVSEARAFVRSSGLYGEAPPRPDHGRPQDDGDNGVEGQAGTH